MPNFKVVCTDYPVPYDFHIEKKILAKADANFYPRNCQTEKDVIEACWNADAVMTVYAPIGKNAIKTFERCRIIARYGVGVDNIDVNMATEKRIIVTNVSDYCIYEVASHTLALILCLNRKIVSLHSEATRKKNWNIEVAKPILRLEGQTLGLVGFGRIGQMVARLAKSLDLSLLAFDPYVRTDIPRLHDVEPVGLKDLLMCSDFVSIHAPLTPETRYMIAEPQLQMMKPSAFLINTARGAIIDESALYEALKNNWIAGVALDVLEEEPPREDNPLLQLSNVIITPHSASYSVQSYQEVRTKTATEVARVLCGRWPTALVNPEVKAKVRWRHNR